MSFSKDFIWGAASAAAQVEGAWNEDGRTPSIWDVCPDGEVKRNENCHVACNHYHHYKEDVALMKKIGLQAYRFSVSWSRVMPERGKVNEKGIKFYQELTEELLKNDIMPMVTLLHSDMPLWVYELGGFEEELSIKLFEEYTEVVVKALGDKVKYWFTLNEPQCMTADYKKWHENADICMISRNMMMAHGCAVKKIRQCGAPDAKIGLAIMGTSLQPTASNETEETIREDVSGVSGIKSLEQARRATFSERSGLMGMGWWMNPIILRDVPDKLKSVISEKDLDIICQPLDFYAANVYQTLNYADQWKNNPLVYPGMPRNLMGWAICPDTLYYFSKIVWEQYRLPILFTENGYCNLDFVMLDGKVHDPQRIDYMKRYLRSLRRALEEGIPVLGYLYWSIMDNFEWREGYDKRFGLIYVDYRTMKRTLKDSAFFYADVIRTNGENLYE